MVLSGSERIATISLAVLTQFQRVTDRRTDGHQKIRNCYVNIWRCSNA